jgi:hypothetical protein
MTTRIEETPGAGRLGRHVEHDPRSLAFPAPVADTLATTLHKRHSRVLDQGDLGSCTGNAMTGLLGTDPHYRPHTKPTDNETLAVRLYGLATQLDGFDGTYPPDDTGSTGLAVAKAAQQLGLIASYSHAFGLDHALHALVLAPVIIGVNWYDSFDKPDPHGYVDIASGAHVRGGHEFELIGLDVDRQRVQAVNSWGTGWSVRGHFEFSFNTFDRLLQEDGDCTTIA